MVAKVRRIKQILCCPQNIKYDKSIFLSWDTLSFKRTHHNGVYQICRIKIVLEKWFDEISFVICNISATTEVHSFPARLSVFSSLFLLVVLGSLRPSAAGPLHKIHNVWRLKCSDSKTFTYLATNLLPQTARLDV